jgi:hypothetical protein
VIADVVMRQSPNDVHAISLFEDPRSLADQLEGRPNIELGQIVRNTERCIVGDRIDIVFGVEPKDYVNGIFRKEIRGQKKKEDE